MTREQLIEFATFIEGGSELLGKEYIESKTDEWLEKQANKNLVQSDVMLRFFADWLQRNQYLIMKRNPNHRAGEGYSPSKYVEWSMSEVMEKFEQYSRQKNGA